MRILPIVPHACTPAQSGSDNFTCPICRAPLFLKPCEDGSTSDPARLGDVQPGITAARRLVQALIALAPAVPSSDVDLELQGMDLPWPVDAPNIMVLGLDEFGGRHGVGGDGLGVWPSSLQCICGCIFDLEG